MLEQNQEMIDNSVQDQTKVVSLFQFIRELNKLKQKAIVNYAEYPGSRTVASLPDDPDNISVFYRDRVENDDSADDGNILLSVRKPEFEKCPTPDPIFAEWLQPGWDLFKNEPSYFEIRPTVQNIDTPSDIDNEMLALEECINVLSNAIDYGSLKIDSDNLESQSQSLVDELIKEIKESEYIKDVTEDDLNYIRDFAEKHITETLKFILNKEVQKSIDNTISKAEDRSAENKKEESVNRSEIEME